MSPRNHSNFPGALWRTDNRVREEFLFSSSPLPPSLPLTCSHFHSSLGQFVGSSHLTGFSLTLLARFFFFFFLPFMCLLWSLSPSPAEGCSRTTIAIIARCYLSESLLWTLRTIWGFYFCASTRLFSALAQGEMCSKGTVSARDSFVYISEAVLSNHGAAPETNRPENMQCLTVSTIKSSSPFSLCVCIKNVWICFHPTLFLLCVWVRVNLGKKKISKFNGVECVSMRM